MHGQMILAFSRPMIPLAFRIVMVASYVAPTSPAATRAARGRAVHWWLLGGALAMGAFVPHAS